jgi:voltage-gated potassium channel Kch
VSALPADVLASLRSGLSAGLNAQTISYKVVTDGTPGSPINLSAIITVQTRTYTPDAAGNRMEIADVISVRPMEDEAIIIGDIITYSGHDYTVRETAGTDVRRITAAYVPTVGWQRTDRFRAEGG